MNYVQNISVPSGASNCYDANQTLYIAGGGTTFIVESGGAANFIAGQKILLEPGLRVNSGGHMTAKITTTGQFCNKSLTQHENTEGIGDDPADTETDYGNGFRIYPNPTTGTFTLELTGNEKPLAYRTELISSEGRKIGEAEFTGEKKHLFSLADQPVGVYFLRVICGNNVKVFKVVRQ